MVHSLNQEAAAEGAQQGEETSSHRWRNLLSERDGA